MDLTFIFQLLQTFICGNRLLSNHQNTIQEAAVLNQLLILREKTQIREVEAKHKQLIKCYHRFNHACPGSPTPIQDSVHVAAPPPGSAGGDVRSLVGCHPKETLHCCRVTLVVFSSACSDSTYAGDHLLCPLLTTILVKSRSQTEWGSPTHPPTHPLPQRAGRRYLPPSERHSQRPICEVRLCGPSLPTGPIALPGLGRSQSGLKHPTWLWWDSKTSSLSGTP